jgi:hypothetical protein
MFDLAKAIESLCPGAAWVLTGNDYKGLDWKDQSYEKPSELALIAEDTRLAEAWKRTEYQRLRALKYPPITDYLDAVVKGDTTGVQQYVAACLAVKAKYPKPVSN